MSSILQVSERARAHRVSAMEVAPALVIGRQAAQVSVAFCSATAKAPGRPSGIASVIQVEIRHSLAQTDTVGIACAPEIVEHISRHEHCRDAAHRERVRPKEGARSVELSIASAYGARAADRSRAARGLAGATGALMGHRRRAALEALGAAELGACARALFANKCLACSTCPVHAAPQERVMRVVARADRGLLRRGVSTINVGGKLPWHSLAAQANFPAAGALEANGRTILVARASVL
mmetsp:Transcript_118324/g.339567  ORF Transcript_118324/g.339567 Transcript_118324/m.339567 type:complete len:238 (+) Transcript_118324:482-1195(+)